METKKLQLTREELEDINFALLIAISECREQGETPLVEQLVKLENKIYDFIN